MSQSEAREQTTELEACLALGEQLGLREGLPYSPNWSAAPDFLKRIVEHAQTAKPTTIVECGSGVTTLMLARCCELNGGGRVFSLENGAEYAEKTRSEIARYGLDKYATVVYAPLTKQTVNGREYQWYALENLLARNIDMLVIDGPPGFIQRHSRYPALPLLYDRLAEDCVVFLDDAGRPDEREIVAMWQADFPGMAHEYLSTERGCSILHIRSGQV